MAKIPTANELGFRSPTAVSKGGGTPQISMRKDMAAVETPAALKGMQEWGERIANEEYAKAEVQFQIGAMAEAQKYTNDSDLDTIEERHAAGMRDQMGKAAAHITSNKARQMFMIRAEEGVAKANYQMNQKTTRRKNDREKGHMASAIDLMVKGGKDLEYGDPGEAALGIQLTLDSMVERNVISQVEAQDLLRTSTLDMAYGRLKAMDPKQQLEIINNPDPKVKAWLDDVPPETIRALKEQAEQQDMNNVAQDYAMGTRGQDALQAVSDMYDLSVKENWDDDRVQATRLRILRIGQDDEVMKQKELDDYYEEGAASIYAGETSLEQLEATPAGIEMLKKLSNAQRNNLVEAQDQAIERQAGRGRKYSERAVVDELHRLQANGQQIQARKYWSENYAKLNDRDFEHFNAATSPTKSKLPEFKTVQTTRQVVKDYLDKYPATPEEEEKMYTDLQQQAMDYYIDTGGKNPTDLMRQQWVRDKHAEVVLDPPYKLPFGFEIGGDVVLERDLTDEQRAIVEPITNVWKAAGYSGEDAAKEFSALTEPERAEFQRLRRLRPNMRPLEFLERFKRGLQSFQGQVESQDVQATYQPTGAEAG